MNLFSTIDYSEKAIMRLSIWFLIVCILSTVPTCSSKHARRRREKRNKLENEEKKRQYDRARRANKRKLQASARPEP